MYQHANLKTCTKGWQRFWYKICKLKKDITICILYQILFLLTCADNAYLDKKLLNLD